MSKKKENKDEYFTLQEIRDDYFKNYEIEGVSWKKINEKKIFYKYGVLSIFIICWVIFIWSHMIGLINIKEEYLWKWLFFFGGILAIVNIVAYSYYFETYRLLKKFGNNKIRRKQSKTFKKNSKINNKTNVSSIKENFYIGLFMSTLYWSIIIFINLISCIKDLQYSFLFLLIFGVMITIITMIVFTFYLQYEEIKYVKEKREELTFLNLYILYFFEKSKYKKLKEEIMKGNQDKFFEKNSKLNNIEMINCLIEECEKEIIYNKEEIDKKNNFLIYQTWVVTSITLIISKDNYFDPIPEWVIILGCFIAFPFLLKIVQIIYNIYYRNKLSRSFRIIKQNKEFIHVLQKRKFILLQQQQLENNHLSSIEIDKEKTIDNKLILG